MSPWVSTLPISCQECLIHFLLHRPSIETPKEEHTGLTPAQRRAYGKCPMVRLRLAPLLVIVQNHLQSLNLLSRHVHYSLPLMFLTK